MQTAFRPTAHPKPLKSEFADLAERAKLTTVKILCEK